MREILFRGKHKETGKWLVGFYSDDSSVETDFPVIEPLRGTFCPTEWMIDPETVGQYTGMTDKNGKKIFEGDIVKINQPFSSENNGDLFGFVEYRSDIGCFEINLESGKSMYTFLDWAVDQKRGNMILIEVVGNIHDNPELLEAVE